MLEHIWRKLIRFGFRLLYNELAWAYDAVSWVVSLGNWREWQRAALPFIEGTHILEIGHGPGHMLATLQMAGYQVIGLDLSPFMGRLAQNRTAASLIRGKVQDLPFATAIFDTILSTFPTNFIIYPETITAVSRTLKPGGRFVIVPAGQLTGNSHIHRFIEWLYQITGQRQEPFSLDESQQWPLRDQWEWFEELFRTNGFEIDVKHIELDRSIATIMIADKL